MTKIKICGITDQVEIPYINQILPDYAGFVFAKSRRQVTAELALELGGSMAPSIRKVGVFVDQDVSFVAEIACKTGLAAIQLHGKEGGEFVAAIRPLLLPHMEIWKALRIDAWHMPEPGTMNFKGVDRILLDTYVSGADGGTGKAFDWGIVPRLGISLPIVLAGGLNPENVREAVRQVSPFAVDVSSGVEKDGKKDEQKLKAFAETVRGGAI